MVASAQKELRNMPVMTKLERWLKSRAGYSELELVAEPMAAWDRVWNTEAHAIHESHTIAKTEWYKERCGISGTFSPMLFLYNY